MSKCLNSVRSTALFSSAFAMERVPKLLREKRERLATFEPIAFALSSLG